MAGKAKNAEKERTTKAALVLMQHMAELDDREVKALKMYVDEESDTRFGPKQAKPPKAKNANPPI